MSAPAPRLEFRWRKNPEDQDEKDRLSDWGDDTHFCDYGLIMPLKHEDMRAEGEDGTLGVNREKFYKFGTTAVGGSRTPSDGQVPFRDGAHASWDAEALGGLPVWVLSISGHHAPRPTPST